MITFGEVIKFKEAEYVYLAGTEEIFYLAKILSPKDGEAVNNLYLKRIGHGAGNNFKIADSPVYCFVTLTTEMVKDRLAHFFQPGHDSSANMNFNILGRLNDLDLKEIQQTIISGPVPIELKELVKNIAI